MMPKFIVVATALVAISVDAMYAVRTVGRALERNHGIVRAGFRANGYTHPSFPQLLGGAASGGSNNGPPRNFHATTQPPPMKLPAMSFPYSTTAPSILQEQIDSANIRKRFDNAIRNGAALSKAGLKFSEMDPYYSQVKDALVEFQQLNSVESIREFLKTHKDLPIGVDSVYIGQTHLQVALAKGDTRLIQYLIDNGADLNRLDAFGHTPLQSAVFATEPDSFIYLFEQMELPNDEIQRIFSFALENATEQTAILDFLLKNGASVDAEEGDGVESPMLHAIKARSSAGLNWLLRRKADINSQDPKTGKTPLMEAARTPNLKRIGYGPYENHALYSLMSRRADPRIKDDEGKTALDYASELGPVNSAGAKYWFLHDLQVYTKHYPDIVEANKEMSFKLPLKESEMETASQS